MGTPPLVTTFQFVVDEIYNCVVWMSTVQFRGVPLIGYIIGLFVLSIGIDYIFR